MQKFFLNNFIKQKRHLKRRGDQFAKDKEKGGETIFKILWNCQETFQEE